MAFVPMFFSRVRRIVVFALFSMATIIIGAFAFYPQLLPFDEPKAGAGFELPQSAQPIKEDNTAKPLVAGKPIRIIIEGANINLPVIDGTYNATTRKWSLSNDNAHYALVTPPANNQGGNTLIYGHNRRSVFASLNRLTPGDMAILQTDNGHKFYYLLRSITDVEPTDVSLFQYLGKPILTVQTCSGSWYENRRLFTFDLVKVEESLV